MKINVKKLFVPLVTFFFTHPTFAGQCLFGAEIHPLIQNKAPQLQTRALGPQIKLDRTHRMKAFFWRQTNAYNAMVSENPEPLRVQVVEIKQNNSHKIYHLNYTEEDQFDGGNSFGWIEDLETLELVATVQDSQILDCTVMVGGERFW